MSGPERLQQDAMRKCHARATYLETQHNVHWHGHYMHALMSSHYCSCLQKLASSPASIQLITTECAHVIRPYLMLAICAASHSGRRLNGFNSYSVLAITSHLCIHIRVAVQRRTVAAAVSLRVVAKCGACRPAMATMHCTLNLVCSILLKHYRLYDC